MRDFDHLWVFPASPVPGNFGGIAHAMPPKFSGIGDAGKGTNMGEIDHFTAIFIPKKYLLTTKIFHFHRISPEGQIYIMTHMKMLT